MTETKIAESHNSHYQLSNPYYQIYTSNYNLEIAKKQESSMGTAIAVYKLLQLYIHDIQTEAGTAISIDFFFPQNHKLRIISIYLPSNNNKLKDLTQHTVTTWTNYAIQHDYSIIILGNFNSDLQKHTTKPKLPLFNTLQTNGIMSLLQYFDITLPTWSRPPLYSQIDDIWISISLLSSVTKPELIDAELITNSDYKIIHT